MNLDKYVFQISNTFGHLNIATPRSYTYEGKKKQNIRTDCSSLQYNKTSGENWRKFLSTLPSIKPWPNGTPNSSQLEPSYKIKTCIGGWLNGTAKSSQLARNHAIVWIRPRGHIIIRKQLGESWLELAAWGGQTVVAWLKRENLSLIKSKPTPANSSQVGGQTIPNSIEVVNLARAGFSWEYLWPGL